MLLKYLRCVFSFYRGIRIRITFSRRFVTTVLVIFLAICILLHSKASDKTGKRRGTGRPSVHRDENGVLLELFGVKRPNGDFKSAKNSPSPRNNTVLSLTYDEERKYLVLPDKVAYTKNVAIVTPVRDAMDHLRVFVHSIRRLTYPRRLVSVYFAEDGSLDGTAEIAKAIVEDLIVKDGFRYARVMELNLIGGVFGEPEVVYAKANQRKRRAHLARVRNEMLETVLTDEDWILWMDIGVSKLPFDLIEQFLYAGKDVMAASCLRKGVDGINLIEDLNSWKETEKSSRVLKGLGKDELMLEGYEPTHRIYLPHLRARGRVVPIDGVGGCALMVNATCHRNGLKFPEDVYNHHIDTEGLAKLAVNMGYGVYGLPYLEVFH